MNAQLEPRCRLALAVYERAAAVMAQRAGQGGALSGADALIADAEQLAFPGRKSGLSPVEGQLPALTSLVSHLHGHAGQGYYSPRPLAADADAIMPVSQRPTDLRQQYNAIWMQFAAERASLLAAAAAPAVQEVGYHALLQRLAWSMPAPDGGDSDVSLFDFARTSAALAVCLADLPPERQGQEQVALLIGGDVSGVQDWLYTIGSSGAARSLRGRSVYLQLLSEIVALYVLDELGLLSCNLLYVGGGNFYVLAPLSAEAALPDLQRQISTRLLKMHDGALYLALGHALVTRNDLLNRRTGEVWGRVNQIVGARKRQRFGELDDQAMAAAIGEALGGTGKLEDTCAICRRPITPGERAKPVDEDDTANSARNCELCESFSQLGRQLPDAAFLAVTKLADNAGATRERINNWQGGLRAFGYDVQVLEHAQPSKRTWRIPAPDEPELVRVYSWRGEGLGDFPGNPDPRITTWIYRPLAQAAPIDYQKEGQPVATFDQLRTEGVQRWGVLRMDVDNLGQIFQRGLGGSSLSRVVSLSAQMRLLFESHVPLLLDQYNEKNPQSTYLMYAGGDDLFVVAGWSHLPELAALIREALAHFAMSNPHVTISGGISLALDQNYPLYQAARAAARAEDMAKDGGKNRLAFLGQAVPWEKKDGIHYAAVQERVQEIKGWVGKDGKLNRSFLMRLRATDAEWREWQKHERHNARYHYAGTRRLHLGPWQWHLVYSLHRAVERNRDGDVKADVDQFVKAIVAGEIEVLGLEARWAELLTRAGKRDESQPSATQRMMI